MSSRSKIITIRHFEKMGWQVWFDGASASGYFADYAEAVEETKLVEAEVRLGGDSRWKRNVFSAFMPKASPRSVAGWKPLLRQKGNDVQDEGGEDL